MTRPPRIFHALQQANSELFRAVDGLLKAREGIVSAHQVILFVLIGQDGLPAAEVAKRAGMSRTRLTGLLDTLESKALLRREQSIHDGRVLYVFITQAGRNMIDRTKALVNELNASLLEPFDSAQQGTIQAFLKHVMHAANTISQRDADEHFK